MRVFLLAGGDATRMMPFSLITEKSLLKIGGKPIIRMIIDRLIKFGICTPKDIVICCLGKHLADFKHEMRDLEGIKFSPKLEAVGTATHYYYAAEIEQRVREDEGVMVHYADCVTDLRYDKMYEVWRTEDTDSLIHITKSVKHDYSEVKCIDLGVLSPDEKYKVSVFMEKPELSYPTWSGIGIFRHGAIKEIVGDVILGRKIDFGHDVLPMLLKEGKLDAYYTDDRWFDVGNANSYRKLKEAADAGNIFV